MREVCFGHVLSRRLSPAIVLNAAGRTGDTAIVAGVTLPPLCELGEALLAGQAILVGIAVHLVFLAKILGSKLLAINGPERPLPLAPALATSGDWRLGTRVAVGFRVRRGLAFLTARGLGGMVQGSRRLHGLGQLHVELGARARGQSTGGGGGGRGRCGGRSGGCACAGFTLICA